MGTSCLLAVILAGAEMTLYKHTDKNSKELSNPADRQLAYYERYGNGGTRNYSAIAQRTEIDAQYQPGNPHGNGYAVPRILVDNSPGDITIYQSNPPIELLALVQKGNEVWMSVFPQFYEQGDDDRYLNALKNKAIFSKNFKVIPTSSCRTVLDVGSKAMFKMHCPYFISRFDRRLEKGTIQHCVAVTRELKDLLGSGRYPKFAILPESIGVTFNGDKGWGYLVRESAPFPLVADGANRTMIPMFSLYGTDTLDAKAPLLIMQMIDRAYHRAFGKKSGEGNSAADKTQFARQFVLDEIILPLIDFFVVAYREKGILLELHGQNTLIELDAAGLPKRIVHRDLDDAVDVDIRQEKQLGLDGFYQKECLSRRDVDEIAGSKQSIIFDKSIGRMNLDKLAQAMEVHYGIPVRELEKASQEHFEKEFPDFRNYFPAELSRVYNYADEMKAGEFNYYASVPIVGDTARWRPAE